FGGCRSVASARCRFGSGAFRISVDQQCRGWWYPLGQGRHPREVDLLPSREWPLTRFQQLQRRDRLPQPPGKFPCSRAPGAVYVP
ncbi:unnamed protein product, partial [Durusdinium trenchii]